MYRLILLPGEIRLDCFCQVRIRPHQVVSWSRVVELLSPNYETVNIINFATIL